MYDRIMVVLLNRSYKPIQSQFYYVWSDFASVRLLAPTAAVAPHCTTVSIVEQTVIVRKAGCGFRHAICYLVLWEFLNWQIVL